MITGYRALRLTVGVTLMMVVGVLSALPPQLSGASPSATSKATRPFPSLGTCRSGKPSDYVLTAFEVSGMSTVSVTQTLNQPIYEPVVTEPVENHVGIRDAPKVAITESLRNASLPNYTNATPSSTDHTYPNSTNEVIETIAWFNNAKKRSSYLQKISRVNPSQFTVVGKKKIKVQYLGSSAQISIPNSAYIVATTMPAAPKLVFYTLRLGSFIITFAFYGGTNLGVPSTSRFVNFGAQDLLTMCP